MRPAAKFLLICNMLWNIICALPIPQQVKSLGALAIVAPTLVYFLLLFVHISRQPCLDTDE
jgi:hypothetical protein